MALHPGDLVQLVAPSGWIGPERAAAAIETLTGWGLRARLGEHAMKTWFYLAGTDEQRRADLDAAFRDPEVRAVFCLRGGYGAQRIVDDLDYAAVRADPKPLLGFSDITALHVALWCEAHLATLHTPPLVHFDERTRRALMTSDPIVVAADPEGVRVPGRAEGILLGGNLTVLAATAGTRHRPDLTGAILLIETVDEEPYRVDRSLVQLKRSGWFDGLAGVAVGQFTNCTDDGPTPTVQQVLAEQLTSLGIPVLGGLPLGHGDTPATVPLGVPAVLDVDAGTLTADPVDSPSR
ncbi:S66 peptidase family protein [Actinoplanes solisilvae]|uniref:S66 peptidase family protein n=1 Tax=Actinoplanes solisilvae TaxID=2486853 RepID=UPI000FDB557E|nr:LD-carboxypeptidase [Actinoplanes solisilvae]